MNPSQRRARSGGGGSRIVGGRAEQTVSEAIESTTYSSLKKSVDKLEQKLRADAPVGELVYALADVALRAGFLLGRAYEHAGLKGVERVQSGVAAVDALFQRVRVVERRILTMLGSTSFGAIRSVASLQPKASAQADKPSTKPSAIGGASGRSGHKGARGEVKRAEKVLVEHWGGLSKHKLLSAFSRRAIERGAKVEVEHTGRGRKKLARRIAADHLTEDPRYYQKLQAAGLNVGRDGR